MTINYSDIKKCRICESFDLFEVINLGNQPLANNLQLIQNSETKKYPLILCKCNNCDTLQLSIDVNVIRYLTVKYDKIDLKNEFLGSKK